MITKLGFQSFALLALVTVFSFTGSSCNGGKETDDTTTEQKMAANPFPEFAADSAYAYIGKQVAFGNRVPGTESHKACGMWLLQQLRQYCDTVYFQQSTAKAVDGKIIPIYNIVGSFNPAAKDRALFASHWDSRPWADQDKVNADKPIVAANDGASGVGVLIEIARKLQKNPVKYGVDIIFFDAEDYGKSEVENSFCLGSQLWARTPHIHGYKARYGVLLDMVGGNNAKFYWEGYSYEKASFVLSHLWGLAAELGFGNYFENTVIGPIVDDHKYVMEGTGIPMVDVIQYHPESGFAPYWHTHNDNMDNVDKSTLHAVGTSVMAFLFNPPIPMNP